VLLSWTWTLVGEESVSSNLCDFRCRSDAGDGERSRFHLIFVIFDIVRMRETGGTKK
jgi:hypothetical protein